MSKEQAMKMCAGLEKRAKAEKDPKKKKQLMAMCNGLKKKYGK